MAKKSRVLVTGGAGFIGSALVEELINRGDFVTVLDDFSSGSPKNLSHIESKDLKLIRGDIRNFETLKAVTKHVDQIFHLAVLNLRLSLKKPFPVHEVNATGTVNVCMAVKQNPNIKRLVYVSSSEAYGTAKYVPMDEEHPLEPTTPYGASKAAGELYVQSFHIAFNIPSVIVRPFNTYGPRAREDAYVEVIPKFVRRVERGLPPIIFGDGKQTRDFTYVTDTVNGIVLASECEGLLGDRVNIAYGKEVSINEVANIILRVFKKEGDMQPVHSCPRPGDVRRHFASISKANRMLGFKPKVPMEAGIGKYVEWYKEVHNETDREQ
jgi:UDP-glucose 4-epimerase